MLSGILAAATALLVSHWAIAWGALRLGRRAGKADAGPAPSVRPSVVVVVKDEAPRLPQLLRSLAVQTRDDFDLVFVDDRSTDGTGDLLAAFAAAHPQRVQVLAGRALRTSLTPKQQRLDEGAAAARGDVILFTDGDCVVPPGWVEQTAARFADEQVGVVFGQLAVQSEGGFVQDQQAFDLPLFQAFAAGSVGLGWATGGCGNNQAVRRRALAEVGGFAGLGYTLTEDTALVGALRARGWTIDVTVSEQTRTTTHPRTSWRALYHQRLRWMGGLWCAADGLTRWTVRAYALGCAAAVLAVPLGLGLGRWALLLWPAALTLGVATVAAVGVTRQRRGRARWLLQCLPRAAAFITGQALLAALMVPGGPAPVWKGRRLGLRGAVPSDR